MKATSVGGMTDGHQQRRALTAAEQALEALQAGNPSRARQAATQAQELDQVGIFAGLPEVVGLAADEIEGGGSVSRQTWQRLSAVLGPGPLQAIADLEAGRPDA